MSECIGTIHHSFDRDRVDQVVMFDTPLLIVTFLFCHFATQDKMELGHKSHLRNLLSKESS